MLQEKSESITVQLLKQIMIRKYDLDFLIMANK